MWDEDNVIGVAERAVDRVGVVLEACGRVLRRELRGHDLVAAVPRRPDQALPAPRAMPGAVDQRERGQRYAALGVPRNATS